MNEEVKKWLAAHPEYKLINVHSYALDAGDEKFESDTIHIEDNKKYEWLLDKYSGTHEKYLRDEYEQQLADEIDAIEEALLHYEYKEKE